MGIQLREGIRPGAVQLVQVAVSVRLIWAHVCSTPVAIGLGTLGKCCAGSFTGDTVWACMRACVCKRQVTAPNDATKSWKATVSTLQDPATGRQEVWLVLQSGPDSGKTVKALYEIGPNGPETQHLLLACGEPDVASKALAPKDFDTPMVRPTTPCTLTLPKHSTLFRHSPLLHGGRLRCVSVRRVVQSSASFCCPNARRALRRALSVRLPHSQRTRRGDWKWRVVALQLRRSGTFRAHIRDFARNYSPHDQRKEVPFVLHRH